MDIKILVATHKKYWMPEDNIYLPLYVGADRTKDGKISYKTDNTGENISVKNANYCELTGVYWAWKNLKADYVGLVHYRRYFSSVKIGRSKKDCILNEKQMIDMLNKADVLLPRKRHYFIETNYSQYIHAHHKEDLDVTEMIIKEKYPKYYEAYKSVMKKTSGHRFNMFVMKYDLFASYCAWLFDVLFALEERLDISTYNSNDARVFGFVSERLLDVWIETNNIKYMDLPYVFLEKQNWFVKGYKFLMRKINRNGKRK